MNELSEKTLAGAWRYRGKTCEVIREGVEAKKSVDRMQLKDCALNIKGNNGFEFSVAIDGEIAPSRSQSTIGGTKPCGGKRKE